LSIIRALVATAAVSAAVLVPAGAASAQRAVITDSGTADVWQQVYDQEAGQDVYEQVGSLPNTDVTTTTVTHTATRLKVTVQYVDLVKDKRYEPTFRSWLKLDDGSGAVLTVWVDENWEPLTYLVRARADLVSGRALLRPTCAGIKAKFDWTANTLTSSIPRSCLKDPRWVRFHGIAASGERDADNLWITSFEDNAHDDSYDVEHVRYTAFASNKPWTGRIKKG
jgi:hypothetical protein